MAVVVDMIDCGGGGDGDRVGDAIRVIQIPSLDKLIQKHQLVTRGYIKLFQVPTTHRNEPGRSRAPRPSAGKLPPSKGKGSLGLGLPPCSYAANITSPPANVRRQQKRKACTLHAQDTYVTWV